MAMTQTADYATPAETRSGGISIEAKLYAGIALFLALVVTAIIFIINCTKHAKYA